MWCCGFRIVEVIDDDFGWFVSGMVVCFGFEKFVVVLCVGEIGVVLCFDVLWLVCNGWDWYYLFEFCGLVEV